MLYVRTLGLGEMKILVQDHTANKQLSGNLKLGRSIWFLATHSSILAWKIPWTDEPGVHGVTKNRTRLSD